MPGLFESRPEDAAPKPSRRPLTVSELNAWVRALLDEGIPQVLVEGEISNLKRYPSGHTYFTLKDAGAQVAAVLFRGNAIGMRFRPADGGHVVVRGRVSLYEARGAYQVVVEGMEPAGFGALQRALEALKERLRAEGLFDAARKRPLPRLPRRIGVVTSPRGAALRDILRVLDRRFAGLDIVLSAARVQGEGAAEEIAAAIRALDRLDGLDVVIVARGGGSTEDLWAFNEERVARAIASSRAPVISAVGHEIDVTLADLVADLRAPTPSAAAEMVVVSREEMIARLGSLRARLLSGARLLVAEARRRFERARTDRALREAAARVHQGMLRSDELQARLRAAVAAAARGARHRLERGADRLSALSPLAVLARGYAICTIPDGGIVREARALAPGEPVRVHLHRGRMLCEVKEVDDVAPED
ncbi:MAG TPA: exodeoxyribonuclease VII large subunit [Candidatus Polarisedimenticolia bacterium]|jgi:exodeoxyribonuclease VII large subunit|nr:exodeoxyribonuclease VII large subunit [Candidatus Polarisedimenticolia bacterium]